jgi:hypothetical protein
MTPQRHPFLPLPSPNGDTSPTPLFESLGEARIKKNYAAKRQSTSTQHSTLNTQNYIEIFFENVSKNA